MGTHEESKDAKKRREIQQYLFDNDRGVAAFWKLIAQLEVLSDRIHEGTERYRRASRIAPDNREHSPGQLFREATALRLDLETYFAVVSRFFSLCASMTSQEELSHDPLVEQVRRIRNRIVEHGYELDREGSRGFYCDELGPKLISETGETDCPPFFGLEERVGEVLQKYGLTRQQFIGRYMASRGPYVPHRETPLKP